MFDILYFGLYHLTKYVDFINSSKLLLQGRLLLSIYDMAGLDLMCAGNGLDKTTNEAVLLPTLHL